MPGATIASVACFTAPKATKEVIIPQTVPNRPIYGPYNTGQRRVRRAPNVAYDAPGTAADGLRTTDDFDTMSTIDNNLWIINMTFS